MRVVSVQARNFLTFDESGCSLYDLPEVAIIVGPNGSGKSSILKAIEFGIEACCHRVQDSRSYVHNQEVSRSVLVDIGVRLNEHEVMLAVAATVCAFQREVRPAPPKVPLDTLKLTRAVYRAVRGCGAAFRAWFSRDVHFCVVSAPGYAQNLTPYVRISTSRGDLCFDGSHLSRAPFRATSWSVADLPAEIYRRIEAFSPGAFDVGSGVPGPSDEALEELGRGVPEEWFYDALEPRHDSPVSFDLQLFRVGRGDLLEDSSSVSERMELEKILRSFSDKRAQASVFDILALLFETAFVHLSDARVKLASLGAGHPWAPWEPGRGGLDYDAPERLFEMKNGQDPMMRDRYWRLVREFESLTGTSFDVILESRTIQRAQNEPGPEEVRLPVLTFRSGNLSFSGNFAAAGFCELLLVLSSASGAQDSVIALDEPTLNLHPAKQREVARAIVGLASAGGNQLIIVSHSPALVDPDLLLNTFRVSKRNGNTRITRLSVRDDEDGRRLVKFARINPILAQALFATKVVLVEGEAEELGMPPWFAKCQQPADPTSQGVIFIDMHGDRNFPWFARIMNSWDVPFRIIADGKATDQLAGLEGNSMTFPEPDFMDMLERTNKTEYDSVRATYRLRLKDPLIARLMALNCSPPTAVEELWKRLRPFVVGDEV